MPKDVILTQEGLANLRAEYEQLSTTGRRDHGAIRTQYLRNTAHPAGDNGDSGSAGFDRDIRQRVGPRRHHQEPAVGKSLARGGVAKEAYAVAKP